MIQFRPIQTQYDWLWFKQRTSVIRCEDTQGIVAFKTHPENIMAMAVFDSFGPDSCCVHMAIDNPFAIKHGLLHEIGRHLFQVCGLQRIFGMVPSNNPKALKLDKHIGMTEVARIPNGVGTGVDYVIMCLEKKDCRWIEQEREAA